MQIEILKKKQKFYMVYNAKYISFYIYNIYIIINLKISIILILPTAESKITNDFPIEFSLKANMT
jgi:hypothetical protein